MLFQQVLDTRTSLMSVTDLLVVEGNIISALHTYSTNVMLTRKKGQRLDVVNFTCEDKF